MKYEITLISNHIMLGHTLHQSKSIQQISHKSSHRSLCLPFSPPLTMSIFIDCLHKHVVVVGRSVCIHLLPHINYTHKMIKISFIFNGNFRWDIDTFMSWVGCRRQSSVEREKSIYANLCYIIPSLGTQIFSNTWQPPLALSRNYHLQ